MNKEDVAKGVAFLALLSTTGCGVSPPNDNVAEHHVLSATKMYVGVDAECSLYTVGIKGPSHPNVFDPVVTPQGVVAPNGGVYHYSCTEAKERVPVMGCVTTPGGKALVCERKIGEGYIRGSMIDPPARMDTSKPISRQFTHPHRGAGWAPRRQG